MNLHTEVTDAALAKALGEELRRVREAAGWSRAQLVARLPSGIGERTLLSYEHGTRQVSVSRLVEICEGLGVSAPRLLSYALQRARTQLMSLPLQIDLYQLMEDESPKFRSMSQWARNRLKETPSGIAELAPSVVRELATLLGYLCDDLTAYLSGFTPEVAVGASTPSNDGADGELL